MLPVTKLTFTYYKNTAEFGIPLRYKQCHFWVRKKLKQAHINQLLNPRSQKVR